MISMNKAEKGTVVAVSLSGTHTFSKETRESILLLTGLGVEGDAHCGTKVKHRSRVAQNPDQPNIRQVHLIQSELFGELNASGFSITPGLMGENIATKDIDLLSLPKGTKLYLGESAVIEITGLRNPCAQLDDLQAGLMAAILDKDAEGNLIRKCGVMSIVLRGGEVRPGDTIRPEMPPTPHEKLERV